MQIKWEIFNSFLLLRLRCTKKILNVKPLKTMTLHILCLRKNYTTYQARAMKFFKVKKKVLKIRATTLRPRILIGIPRTFVRSANVTEERRREAKSSQMQQERKQRQSVTIQDRRKNGFGVTTVFGCERVRERYSSHEERSAGGNFEHCALSSMRRMD